MSLAESAFNAALDAQITRAYASRQHPGPGCRCSACTWRPPTVRDAPKPYSGEVSITERLRRVGELVAAGIIPPPKVDLPPLTKSEDMQVTPPKHTWCTCPEPVCQLERAVREMRATTEGLQAHLEIGRVRKAREKAERTGHYTPPPPKADQCEPASVEFSPMAVENGFLEHIEKLRDRAFREAGIGPQYLTPPPPAPKCPPSCTPARPCGVVMACTSVAYLQREKAIDAKMAGFDIRRKPKRPRPELRSIGAAGLTFGRWNGRVPR